MPCLSIGGAKGERIDGFGIHSCNVSEGNGKGAQHFFCLNHSLINSTYKTKEIFFCAQVKDVNIHELRPTGDFRAKSALGAY